MSRRRNLEQHRLRLDETREIMNSMKALAFMETQKLASFIDAQRAVVSHVHRVAEDFFSFYPPPLTPFLRSQTVYLLLGSERGFCGDFNEALVVALLSEREEQESEDGQQTEQIIAIGTKLCELLAAQTDQLYCLNGVSVVEDIESTLMEIVDRLKSLQEKNTGLSLRILYHDPDQQEIMNTQVLPPVESRHRIQQQFTYPPQLNIRPEEFCRDLIDRYLFSSLHETLYLSLMAENQRRVTHLESAVQQLDDKAVALSRRSNTLRQEEITEEIEIILLSTASLNDPGRSA
jgi:F-type H+-transporting ATPase subunit gamma